MKIIITGIILFMLIKPYKLIAQNVLTDEWEKQYLKHK